MSEITTDVSVATLERSILSRMEYLRYLKALMVKTQNSALKVQSFVEFSGVSSDDPIDDRRVYSHSLDQVDVLMLIEAQTERVSQTLKLRQALGSLNGAALNGNP